MCTWLKSFQWFQQKATYANILDHYQQQINREMHLASIDNDADTFEASRDERLVTAEAQFQEN